MRIIRTFLYIFMALLLMLSGCKPTVKNDSSKEVKDELEGTVVMWVSADRLEAVNMAANSYMEKHNKVKLQLVNMKPNDLYEKINRSMYTGTEIPDLILIESEAVNTLASRFPSSFSDFSDAFDNVEDKLIKTVTSEVTVDGKLRALPWDIAPVLMFYRSDTFNDAGISAGDIKTWEEYMDAGKKIATKTSGVTKMLPINFKDTDEFLRIVLYQLNEGYFSKEGKKASQLVNFVKAENLIKSMYTSGIVYDYVDDSKLAEDISAGKIASVITNSKFIISLMNHRKDLSGKWEIRNLPAFEPGGRASAHIGGTSIMQPKVKENNKAAADFIKFLITDKENMIKLCNEKGIYPSMEDFYFNKDIVAKTAYFEAKRAGMLMAGAVKEFESSYYPKDFKEAQKLAIESQQRILFKNEDIKAVMEQLINGLPLTK